MSVIDYSKWDRMNYSSDEEEEEQQQQQQPAKVMPTPSKPKQQQQQQPAKVMPTPSKPKQQQQQQQQQPEKQGQVQCVRVFCTGDQRRRGLFETVVVDSANHPVLSAPISPVSERIQLPLHVYLENPLRVNPEVHPQRARYDNQPITYIMIEPNSGFAPRRYQAGVGTVLVARHDMKPLTEQHLEAIWQFCSHLLEKYGEGYGVVVPSRDITRPKFERFFARFKEEKGSIAESHKEIGEGLDDWGHVESPYDL